MMEALRQWLLGVVGCAFAVRLVDLLAPEGAVREIARFCGGLALILCMLRPFGVAERQQLVWDMEAFSGGQAALEAQYQSEWNDALAPVIAERTGAYIEDKARALGLTLTAEVTVSRRDDGLLLPERAVLFGARNAALAALMEEELGIPPERQEWRTAE